MQSAQELVSSWKRGRATIDTNGKFQLAPHHQPNLVEKFRSAYQWISQEAIYSPFQDMSFGPSIRLGSPECQVSLPRQESFASFLLLPILTLLTSRTLLFIGAPGRGKTSVATLMALLTGYDLQETRRAIQHGHPQLTIADLLGSPLPSDLVKAKTTEEIRVIWRNWLKLRVKIIDEYNRIPTKTQSALLSLMAEGYAEMYEQTIESGRSAWYLTANDDLGGGTFPVIEALKDRIDIVVRCTPFHAKFLDQLEARITHSRSPEAFVPKDLIFSPKELETAQTDVRAIEVPKELQMILGFFMGQLDFCRRASKQIEWMNKDTLHLSGKRVGFVCNEDCPLDKQENLCTQTENGISTRAYQSLLHYAKALAYFRGQTQVSLDDLQALAPWILHERLQQNPHSAFFQKAEHHSYTIDRVSWIRQLFDKAIEQYTAYQDIHETCTAFQIEFEESHQQTSHGEIRKRMNKLQKQMEQLANQHELNGPVHDDLVLLKMLYTQYQRMLRS